jgi:hypothetical protein
MPATEGAQGDAEGPLANRPPAVRRAIVGLVVAISALGLLGTALSPYLLVKHPLLLVALSPDARHIVLAASQVDLGPLLAVAAPRRALALLGTYGLAGIYGFRFIRYAESKLPRVARMFAWLKRMLDRVGLVLIFLFPTHALAGLCGATGTRLKPFLIAMVPGQVPFILMYYFAGEAIAGFTAKVIAFLSANLVESTLVATALVLLQQLVSRLRRRRLAGQAADSDAPVEP